MNEKGAILSYIQVFLSVVVSMIYVPVLLHFLGQSEYGLYQIVGSFFSYVTVFRVLCVGRYSKELLQRLGALRP